MSDGEALVGPRMKDARLRQPLICEPIDPGPNRAVLLTAARQRSHPEHQDMVSESPQSVAVGRYGVISKEARHDLPQPRALIGDRCKISSKRDPAVKGRISLIVR
jgi:hypothetical protein